MTASTIPPLLSPEEVGLIIGRHPKTVLQLAQDKKISCIRQNAKSVQFTEDHVRAYLASCEVPAEPVVEPEPTPTRHPKYGER